MSTLLAVLAAFGSVARAAEPGGQTVASTASSGPASAAMPIGSPSTLAGPASLVERLNGVYKARLPNGDVSGATHTSENILEVVRHGPDAAYVRVRLEFYNGHTCVAWGIARVEGDELVYRERTPADPIHACRLSVSLQNGKVVLADSLAPDGIHSCVAHCGSRGSMNAVWPASARRPIRYMATLLNSRQYKAAVAEFEGEAPGARRGIEWHRAIRPRPSP